MSPKPTFKEIDILRCLATTDRPMNSCRIGKRKGIVRSTVGSALLKLQRLGYVVIEPVPGSKMKEKRCRITPEGRTYLESQKSRAVESFQQIALCLLRELENGRPMAQRALIRDTGVNADAGVRVLDGLCDGSHYLDRAISRGEIVHLITDEGGRFLTYWDRLPRGRDF